MHNKYNSQQKLPMTLQAENSLLKIHLTVVPWSCHFFLCRFSSTVATTAVAAAAAFLTMVTVDPKILAATDCSVGNNDNNKAVVPLAVACLQRPPGSAAACMNEVCSTIIPLKIQPMDGVDFAGATALMARVNNGRGNQGEIQFGLDLDTALCNFFHSMQVQCRQKQMVLFVHVSSGLWCMPCQIYNSLPPIINPRFAVTVFTYRKNGGKLPVTGGKPGNYHIPIGKNLFTDRVFLTVKLNFQWWHLGATVNLSGNFQNYQKKYRPKILPFTMFNLVNYR